VLVLIAVYTGAFRSHTPMTARPAAQPGPAGHAPEPVPAAPSAATSPSEVQPPPPTAAQRDAQRQEAARLTWGRDPFLSGGGAGSEILSLSGILWDAREPLAIINGQTVHVGEEVGGYHVTDITHDHVTVTDGTQAFQLRLAP